MNIKSKDIKKYVYLKLGKKETEEVNNEELNKITFLNLNYKNFKDEINEYDFNDLKQFKNLKELTLNGFEITEEMISNINQIDNLEILVINHCSFVTNKELISNLRRLVLTYTKINNLTNFKKCSDLENIEFIDCGDVDINNLIELKMLKEILVYNSEISNALELRNFDKLRILKIDGSKLDYENLESVISSDIEFSHEERFYLIG